MPRLWDATIEAHRSQVRDAILDTTAALVANRGLLAVTMSQIAEATGIGRATLYKYFPDVEAILSAWHERQIAAHLAQLTQIRDQVGDPDARLRAVLEAYAMLSQRGHGQHDSGLVGLLHRDQHVAHAQQQVHGMIRDLLAEAAVAGHVRDDVPAGELATYCLHALTAAGSLPSAQAVHRLVMLTVAAVRRSS
ncbi:TetR/AcrR family transcriptional regulator [Micromonospora sp. CPCC 206061]|uniref:TetR/AcrR family transcriptional regulator n=1 Tax=Micromonospora sp. CPCC 206061 TaxID=3122410 RepID=UPI002FF426F2